MPVFAWGGQDSIFNPFANLGDRVTVTDIEEGVRELRVFGNTVFEFGLKKAEQIGAVQALKIVESGGLLGVEVAKQVLHPGTLGHGEEAAIAQQEERARQERDALDKLGRPKPMKVERTDP